ncbi:MAG: toxin-antitoxin system YwqK family antitoxin [Leptospiraceae bacterium]|nr:toxin-antitoxin system YwqK family antitoxin [Leptospiraceae bacterium]
MNSVLFRFWRPYLLFAGALLILADLNASQPPVGVKKGAIWNEKGQVYVLDQKGQRAVWYKDGTRRASGGLSSKGRDGLWHFYYPNGKIEAKGVYQDGSRNGAWEWYADNAVLSSRGSYKQNSKEGLWEFYYPDQKIKMAGLYQSGRRIGTWKNYYPDGQLFYQGDYNADEPHGNWTYYYKNGQLLQKGQMSKGVRVGSWQICVQPGGPCQTEQNRNPAAPRLSHMQKESPISKSLRSTRDPAALLEGMDAGGVPDQTPHGLKNNNPWDR